MALTPAELLQHAGHRLGGPVVDLAPLALVNQAGKWIVTLAHTWKFLERPPVSIPLNTVDVNGLWPLPADISEFSGAPVGSLAGKIILPTTLQTIMDMQALGVNPGRAFYAAIVHEAASSPPDGPPIPRLKLYPIPSLTSTDSINIYYRSGWSDLLTVDDSSYTNTPDWFDPLLIQAVRAYFMGIQTDTMDEQLGRVKASALFEDTRRRDGSIQRRLGPYKGSGVRRRYGPIGGLATTITYQFP